MSQPEGRQPHADQLTLSVLRRGEDHQPRDLARHHPVQRVGNQPVGVFGHVLGKGVLREGQ
jgi:hypothetical protein